MFYCCSTVVYIHIIGKSGRASRTTMDNRQFKENVRLGQSTFEQLVEQVRPHMQRADTILRSAIPVEKRIACALYAVRSTSEMRTVANLFGTSRSTACELLHSFCTAIVDIFFQRLVKFPATNQEVQETIEEFLLKHDNPMCLGAVDGTHISMKAPLSDQLDYYNYKKYHSIVMRSIPCSSTASKFKVTWTRLVQLQTESLSVHGRPSVRRAKKRFRCLHSKMEFQITNAITIIKATTVLHNLCSINGDGVEVEWDVQQTV